MAPTLRAKNEKPPERATQKEDGGSSYSSDSDSHKVPPEPEQAKRREARPAEAQSPERKRKRPSAKSPELKKKKANPLDPKRNAPSAEAKKTLPFQRTWIPNDEVRILEVLAAHRQEHGELPNSHVLFASLDGRLDRKRFRRKDLDDKVRSLKRRHNNDAKKGTAPTKEHERCLYHLSKNVWGDMPKPMDATGAKSGGGQTNMDAQVPSAGKTFDEMRELYPYLTQELILLVDAEAQPAVLERVLPSIDDSKAQALELKIMKLKEELTKAVMESARMQSMEMPKVWQFPSTKLQQAQLRAENENCFLLGRLEKLDGVSIGAKEQLARMEHQIVQLKQIVIASLSSPKVETNRPRDNSPAKGIRCESAESVPQSVEAENQFPCNILQRKIAAQKQLPHGKNEEVTSKYRCPGNVIPQRMMLAPKNIPHGRKEKIDAESQILRDVVKQRKVTAHAQQDFSHERNDEGGKEVILLSILWPHDPVAKATLQTSSRSAIVGGMPLGSECCQVFVNDVLKREAPLLRPFGNMKKMVDALKCSIAWPCGQIQHDTIAGMVAPDRPSRPGQ